MGRWAVAFLFLVSCGTEVRSSRDAGTTPADDDAQVEPDTEPVQPNRRAVLTLATNQRTPFALAIDKTSLYWTATGDGKVVKVPLNGGALTFLASSQSAPEGIAVFGGRVYWLCAGSGLTPNIVTCPTSGCGSGPTPLWAGNTQYSLVYPFAITVDATNVFHVMLEQTNALPVMVAACSNTGCFQMQHPVLTEIPSDETLLASNATDVFISNGNRVLKCAKTGCMTPTVLASLQVYPRALVADAKNVYWVNRLPEDGSVMRCSVNGCGNKPTALATKQKYPTGIAVDETYVYWTNQYGGTINKCAIDGCGGNAETIISGQDYPHAIVVDDKSVYWSNLNGLTVMKATPK